MNSFPNLQILPKSVKTRSNIPLNSEHLTTMNFGATNLTYCTELVPTDKISIDMSALAQLAPMVVPTMGTANLYCRAFFVPYRFVWKHWEDFFSGKAATATGSTIYEVPQIGNFTLSNYIVITSNGFSTSTGSSSYDFSVIDSSGTTLYRRLTARGSRFVQVLNALGYHYTPYDASVSTNNTEFYSALPLLSLAKVFRDYYVNPNYDYTSLDAIFENDLLSSGVGSPYYLTYNELDTLYSYIEWCWFDNDVFNSAWINPESPMYANSQLFKGVQAQAFDQFDTTVRGATQYDNSYVEPDTSTGTTMLTQTALNLLLGVRNFVMRQSAAGGRFIDQLYSRFGIKLHENEARRAMFLGSTSFGLNISRVDATSAGTDGSATSQLGDFTGRGTMNGGGHFEFDNDKNDFGMFFIISHIIPENHYWQGDLPHVEHKTLFDFYNGDVENVGLAPINTNAVFHDFRNIGDYVASQTSLGSVFGYAPNYWEYKTGFDRLTGNFALDTRNTELKSFHMFRDVANRNSITGNIIPTIGEEFQLFNENIQTQFDRIFLNQTNDFDPFIVSFRFKINCNRPMQSIGTSLYADLKEHGGEIGDAVKVRPNGKYF